MEEKYRGKGEWKITKVAAFKYSKGIRVSILFSRFISIDGSWRFLNGFA